MWTHARDRPPVPLWPNEDLISGGQYLQRYNTGGLTHLPTLPYPEPWPRLWDPSLVSCYLDTISRWSRPLGGGRNVWRCFFFQLLRGKNVLPQSSCVLLSVGLTDMYHDQHDQWWRTVLVLLSYIRAYLFSADWTTEIYSDVARMLAKCDNVYSADVPGDMRDIAQCMDKEGTSEKFLDLSVDVSCTVPLWPNYLLQQIRHRPEFRHCN